MAQSNITVKIDESIKKEFNYFCEKLGLNMSTAINLFIYSVLREKRIPFELKLNEEDLYPFYSSKNMNRLKKSIEQMENNGGTIHEVNYDQDLD